jgi:hypothetical protein
MNNDFFETSAGELQARSLDGLWILWTQGGVSHRPASYVGNYTDGVNKDRRIPPGDVFWTCQDEEVLRLVLQLHSRSGPKEVSRHMEPIGMDIVSWT